MTTKLGTPVWIDFGSDDFDASKAFYQALFGWEFEDSGPDMNHYNMIYKDGDLVGGAMDVAGMTCPTGDPIPSYWDVYLAVDDIEATIRKAEEHGAHVIVPLTDAGDAGRHAVLLDPTNASVGLWQAGELEGYAFSGKPGTPVWFELMTQDFEASREFYGKVFDFSPVRMVEPMDENFRYATNGPADQASSGMWDAKGFVPEEHGSFWRVYLCTKDCDAAMAKVKELGGSVLDGPVDSPFGRLATVQDPAGASFQLCAPSQAVSE